MFFAKTTIHDVRWASKELKERDVVFTYNLKTAALNYNLGVIGGAQHENGRWPVYRISYESFDASGHLGEALGAMKAENLQFVPPPTDVNAWWLCTAAIATNLPYLTTTNSLHHHSPSLSC